MNYMIYIPQLYFLIVTLINSCILKRLNKYHQFRSSELYRTVRKLYPVFNPSSFGNNNCTTYCYVARPNFGNTSERIRRIEFVSLFPRYFPRLPFKQCLTSKRNTEVVRSVRLPDMVFISTVLVYWLSFQIQQS